MTRLYVGNLPFTADEQTLRELFAPHGSVNGVTLINDRDTGAPRGFGFVEMDNSQAVKAVAALNGTQFAGRALKVNEAQERGGPKAAGIGAWRGR